MQDEIPDVPPPIQTPKKTYFIMKVAAVSLLAIILSLLAYYSNLHERLFTSTPRLPDLGPELARPAPYDFEFQTTDGTKSLVSYRGQVVHINVWASWCKPCETELPIIESLQNQFRGQYQAILINVDNGDEIKKLAQNLQKLIAPTPIAIYDRTKIIEENMKVSALPFHLVIDKNGRTASVFYGGLDKLELKFKDQLRQLFSEQVRLPPTTLVE